MPDDVVHGELTSTDVHTPYRWTPANAAARILINVGATLADDLYCKALQLDDGSEWVAVATGTGHDKWVPANAGGARTVTTADFTQPAPNATVAVSVRSTANMVANRAVRIGAADYYNIDSVTNSTTLVLRRCGVDGETTTGGTISAGAVVVSASGHEYTVSSVAAGATTWVAPSCVASTFDEVAGRPGAGGGGGGGGGGGSFANATSGGGAGGGGGYAGGAACTERVPSVTCVAGHTYTMTVGSGGTAGNGGNAGTSGGKGGDGGAGGDGGVTTLADTTAGTTLVQFGKDKASASGTSIGGGGSGGGSGGAAGAGSGNATGGAAATVAGQPYGTRAGTAAAPRVGGQGGAPAAGNGANGGTGTATLPVYLGPNPILAAPASGTNRGLGSGTVGGGGGGGPGGNSAAADEVYTTGGTGGSTSAGVGGQNAGTGAGAASPAAGTDGQAGTDGVGGRGGGGGQGGGGGSGAAGFGGGKGGAGGKGSPGWLQVRGRFV